MVVKWYERADLTQKEVSEIAQMVVDEGKEMSLTDFTLFLRLFLRSCIVETEINFHEHEEILRAVWELRK